jgi:hypothetical protein
VKFAAAYKILADTFGLLEEMTEKTPENLIQKLAITNFCACGLPPAAPGENNFRHIAQINVMKIAQQNAPNLERDERLVRGARARISLCHPLPR